MTKQITCQKAVDVVLDKMRFPLWGFRKIDGQRGNHLTGGLTSRELKPFGNPDVTAMFSGIEYTGFDGELTLDGRLTGDDLCHGTGSVLSQSKLKKGQDKLPTNVVWNLFDYLHPDVVHLKYSERYTALDRYINTVSPPGVHLLTFVVIENAEQAQAFIDECIALDFEGAIFRDPEALHKSGRATEKLNDFWRFKPTSEKTVRVKGFEPAMANTNAAVKNAMGHTERSTAKDGLVAKEMIGVLICENPEGGPDLRVGPGKMTHAEREAWFADPTQIVGWEIDYLSLDTGVKDAPRQARFVRRKLPVVA